jgi:hypothetical protein
MMYYSNLLKNEITVEIYIVLLRHVSVVWCEIRFWEIYGITSYLDICVVAACLDRGENKSLSPSVICECKGKYQCLELLEVGEVR